MTGVRESGRAADFHGLRPGPLFCGIAFHLDEKGPRSVQPRMEVKYLEIPKPGCIRAFERQVQLFLQDRKHAFEGILGMADKGRHIWHRVIEGGARCGLADTVLNDRARGCYLRRRHRPAENGIGATAPASRASRKTPNTSSLTRCWLMRSCPAPGISMARSSLHPAGRSVRAAQP